jgi:hypothetical protein
MMPTCFFRNSAACAANKELNMAKKMTLKQKEKLFQQRQNQNFKASTSLDGFEVEEVALDAEQALQRLAELRAHYEQ